MTDPSNRNDIEQLVNAKQAAAALGVSRSYIGAVKNAMKQGGKPVGRKFFVSTIRQWLLEYPDFNSKNHKGDRSLMREALEALKSPRHGQRLAVISKLEKMLQANRQKAHGDAPTRI